MNAILITLNVVVLSGLAALSFVWPPALFAFLIVGPLSLLSFWWISSSWAATSGPWPPSGG
jgi:hypothetical protein